MPRDRRAVCVGINNFAKYPDAALRGCANDAKGMAAALNKYFGFDEQDITVLVDQQATKAAIMKRLRAMVDDAKAGELKHIVFSLSSHGTQVPDLNRDEIDDRADEAFCPYDLAEDDDGWHKDHIIVDDELRNLFSELPKDVLLEAFMDTCHSGTGLRGDDLLLFRRPRYLPPPSIKAFDKVRDLEPRTLHHALAEKTEGKHVLWAACKPNQTSADAKIAGAYHGAFTYYLCHELDAVNGDISRTTLMKRVREDLKANRYTQVPRLEMNGTRLTQSIKNP